MLQPTVRRTWAPEGQTPLLVPSSKHDRWSVITALTVAPYRCRLGLYFQALDHNVCGEDAELFLWSLWQQMRRPMLVIWDRLNAHRTAERALADLGNRIVFEYLPPYAPQLNPVEYAWAHTKHVEMANFCPTDRDHLGQRLTATLLATRSKPPLLRSFFHYAGLQL